MGGPRSLIAPVALVAALAGAFLLAPGAPERDVAGGAVDGARYRLTDEAARSAGVRALPAPRPLRFAAQIAPSDRQVVLQAVAQARPEARRLVELVADLVTIEIGHTTPGTAGTTIATPAGYIVLLDLGGVYRRLGMRGVRRLVLHELAHVVDDALVQRDLEARLDAATPPGFGCDDGASGGCAARQERFAESFAKWATGDVGHDLYVGYRVPPPASLSGWGAPLAAIGR